VHATVRWRAGQQALCCCTYSCCHDVPAAEEIPPPALNRGKLLFAMQDVRQVPQHSRATIQPRARIIAPPTPGHTAPWGVHLIHEGRHKLLAADTTSCWSASGAAGRAGRLHPPAAVAAVPAGARDAGPRHLQRLHRRQHPLRQVCMPKTAGWPALPTAHVPL
jgi:hypothetical protein